MTALADRSDHLLDLAAHSLATGRTDLVSAGDTAAIFQLAVEVLEPQLSDLRRQLAETKAQLEIAQGVSAGLLKARQMERDAAAVRDHIRAVVRRAKAVQL